MTPDSGPVQPATDPRSARRAFLAAALRHPSSVGAVVPSSERLAGVLASVVPREGRPVVVELGPGTGAVSAVIERRLPPGARHLAVELDPAMVAYLHRSLPGLEVVQGDAAHLAALLAGRGVSQVDAVVCGLPWALFGASTQSAILGEVSRVIGTTGAFTTFAYLHGMTFAAARRFRRTLRETFDEVVVSATVWRNVPPAFVYVCRRPSAGEAREAREAREVGERATGTDGAAAEIADRPGGESVGSDAGRAVQPAAEPAPG